MKVIGSFVSPYVRKVLACMELKGLAYAVDPITPFYGNDEFERLSPLRRIPVMIDGDLALSDSSVICAYLEETYSGHALLPADPRDRARARWFEEYADTRMGDVFIWGLFYPKVVYPRVWGEEGDLERVEKCLAVDGARWPRVARFVEDTLAHPVFEKLLAFEKVQLGASVAGRRQALIDAGARLTKETWATKEPRRGIMRL